MSYHIILCSSAALFDQLIFFIINSLGVVLVRQTGDAWTSHWHVFSWTNTRGAARVNTRANMAGPAGPAADVCAASLSAHLLGVGRPYYSRQRVLTWNVINVLTELQMYASFPPSCLTNKRRQLTRKFMCKLSPLFYNIDKRFKQLFRARQILFPLN